MPKGRPKAFPLKATKANKGSGILVYSFLMSGLYGDEVQLCCGKRAVGNLE